jgi:hypothetical protein
MRKVWIFTEGNEENEDLNLFEPRSPPGSLQKTNEGIRAESGLGFLNRRQQRKLRF